MSVGVSGGSTGRHSLEWGLPDTRRLSGLGMKKSGSGPAFAPCPAVGLIAKTHLQLLAGNAEPRIFSG